MVQPEIGDKIDVIIIAEAIITDISNAHGLCYKLKFPQKDYQNGAEREIWLDEDEVKKIIPIEK